MASRRLESWSAPGRLLVQTARRHPSKPGDGTADNSDWEPEDQFGKHLLRPARARYLRAGKRDPQEGIVAAYWRTTGQDPTGDYRAPEGTVEHRCIHCNKMDFTSEEELQHHIETLNPKDKCKWRPSPRTGQSVRYVERAKRQRLHKELPQLEIQGEKLDNMTEWLTCIHGML
eukprot:COSAG05_NODE_746_length_7571_cov_33.023956_3_plen_173_part_00